MDSTPSSLPPIMLVYELKVILNGFVASLGYEVCRNLSFRTAGRLSGWGESLAGRIRDGEAKRAF